MNQKISVIIPCYNQGHFLSEAVLSVLAQNYGNWECIIVNDGSHDNTEEISLDFAKKDKRIIYIKKENGGLSSARNLGMDHTKGDYIQFLDSDDKIASTKFTTSLKKSSNADVIISDFVMFNDTVSNIILPFKLSEAILNFENILMGWDVEFVFPPHSGIFKANLFKGIRFDETLKAREDWLMWLQIFKKNINAVFIDEPLALYRSSPKSMSQNKHLMDESLVSVYKIVYPLLSQNQKDMFFTKVMNSFQNILESYSYQLTNIRQSKSYRIGNFVIKNLNKLRL
ncbi:MAG: glycosyltransferase family 2 protein [Ginsengibacter sp.]